MIQDYQKLPELLHRQRTALAENDATVLESINREIGDLSNRIVNHSLALGRLEGETKAQLRALIEQAQLAVSQNLQLWQEAMAQIQGARSQLQSTRRFYNSLQNQSKTGIRYSKTG